MIIIPAYNGNDFLNNNRDNNLKNRNSYIINLYMHILIKNYY